MKKQSLHYLKAPVSLILILVMLMTTFSLTTAQEEAEFVPVSDLDPQPVVDWMTLFYRLVEAERVSAPGGSRLYAYVGITAYESLLPGMPGNNSLAGQIWHMPDMPLPEENQTYDWLTVANGALSTVIPGIMPVISEESIAAVEELSREQADARAAEVGDDIVKHSLAYGETIAVMILEWAAEDNFAATREMLYEPPAYDGAWIVTTEGAQPAEPYWGELRPFIMEYAGDCNVYPDVPYSTDPESTFYAQAQEVVAVGRNLTDWQEETARFWVDTPGVTGTPAGHWWSISNQLVDQLDLTLGQAAEMWAMMGIVLGDSFISCWRLKYEINLLRPVTYIRENIRRSWSPYIETPPFPEYPSGHSVVSAAAADMLTFLFGARAFTDETHIIYGHEPLQRSYTSFQAAATEAAISRLYGGIHYRSAIENGMQQGHCVARTAIERIRLNPITQGE